MLPIVTAMKAFLVKMILGVLACLVFSACNTIYGVGKDFEEVGGTMQTKAESGIFGSRPAAGDVPEYIDETLLPPQ